MTVQHAYLDEDEDTLHPEQTKKKDNVQCQAIMIAREAHPHQLHQHKLLSHAQVLQGLCGPGD